MKLYNLSAYQAIQKIKQREITVEQYTSQLLKRSKELAYLNAFITLDEQTILNNARNADIKIQKGEMTHLYGLPIAIKDNINTQSIKTTGGTPSLRNFYPSQNSPVVQRMLDNNGIIFGKQNLHELAFGITSNNPVYGKCRNPYNIELFAGGSSGGTACAVAAGMVPIGYGTDTGGSCRVPASLSGCVGFRPTTYRYSQEGVIPISSTKDTIGILARTVQDIALLDDFSFTNNSIQDRNILITPEKLRIGVPRGYFYEDLDSETEIVVEEALKKLKSAGIQLIEQDMDKRLDQLNQELFNVAAYEAIRNLSVFMVKNRIQIPIQDILNNVAGEAERQIYSNIINVPTEEYNELIIIKRPLFQNIYSQYFQTNKIDCFITPTTRLPARSFSEDQTVVHKGKTLSTFMTYIKNTDPSSNAGVPCISIPAGLTPDSKLPVGVELVCQQGQDSYLLAIGQLIQNILGEIPPPNLHIC